MFLDYVKNFVIKKIVDKSLSADFVEADAHKIHTVGILIDESYIQNISKIKQSLQANNIKETDIKFLVRTSQNNLKNIESYPAYNVSSISWTGALQSEDLKNFIDFDFDLLINYYDQRKAALLLVSSLSKANFKVGFSAIDKRINHLIIDSTAAEYEIFEKELFKYLKILNTI